MIKTFAAGIVFLMLGNATAGAFDLLAIAPPHAYAAGYRA
jgi:hypothetical protein